MTKYLDRIDLDVLGSGSLMLYKRDDLKDNDVWHYRAKIEGKVGYLRRSTKETNVDIAKRIADDEFRRYKTRVEDNKPTNITIDIAIR